MAKSFTIRNGKIIVSEEIEITDCALYLKYDWHLYNLANDIRNAKDVRFQDYLKKANELFAEDVSKSRPNKRVNRFWLLLMMNSGLSGLLKAWVIQISWKNLILTKR